MFTKPLNYIITKENLADAYEVISKNSTGLDDVGFTEFKKEFSKNLKSKEPAKLCEVLKQVS